jgi:hypothetical protein
MNPAKKRSAQSATKDRLQEAPVPLNLPHAPASGLPLLASHRRSATQDSVQPSAAPAEMKSSAPSPLVHDQTSTCFGSETRLAQAAAALTSQRVDCFRESDAHSPVPASAAQLQAQVSYHVAVSPPPVFFGKLTLFRSGQPPSAADASSTKSLNTDENATLHVTTLDVNAASIEQDNHKVMATKPLGPSVAAVAELLHHPPSGCSSNVVTQISHLVTEQLLTQRFSKPKPNSRKTGHKYSAAAAAAVLFACSVVGAALVPQIASSYSLGTWSTAVLSAPRYSLAATSLPNLGIAIFAGGYSECGLVYLSCCNMRFIVRRMYTRQEWSVLDKCSCLITCAGGSNSVAVDMFNAIEGSWSTGNLSLARSFFAATSLPNLGVAIFAGGICACCRVRFEMLQNVLLCEEDA